MTELEIVSVLERKMRITDDTDDTSFDARAVANDTTETLEIQVQDTDAAGDTIRWFCTLHVTKLTYS